MRLEARAAISPAMAVAAPAAAIAFTLVVAALFVAWAGAPVGATYRLVFEGGFGSRFAWSETLTRATPLILTGLAAAIAFRAHLYNIGAEGQLYAGALAAVAVGGLHGGTGIDLPAPMLFAAMLAAAALAGAVLMALPAIAKTRFGVDEVVTTLLLNFIVLLFVSMLLEGPLKDPTGLGWPQSQKLVDAARLPRIIQGKRLHYGFVLALVSALAIWVVMKKTALGYEMRAVGHNHEAARFAGIPVNAVLMKTALLSGGLAALAGFSEVSGLKGNLTLDLSPGFGYSGIVVAMLAMLNPLAVVLAAIFVAGIFVGADAMSRTAGVPSYIADVMVATALLTMVTALLFSRYRLRWR